MPQFDVDSARKAGYSDDEILGHLTASRNFDVPGALNSGYSKSDIINHLAGSPQTGPSTTNIPTDHPYQPTRFDRFVSGFTGDLGASQNPNDPIQQLVNGVGSSLGRTTQAWHDMFSGNAGASTLPEMVPLIGPAAVDASRMIATPGQRTEGAGATTALLAPAIAHGAPPISEIVPDLSRPVAVAKGAGKGAWQGATEMVPASHGIVPKLLGRPDINVPATIANAGYGAGAARLLGLGKTGEIGGAVVGASTPIIRGAIKGGKAAAADFDASAIPKTPRPDYSDLISTPWNDVPPYSSSVTPESGVTARALGARPITTRPSPGSSSIALPKPSVTVPWVGQPTKLETAPVPPASSYVATPSSGRLVEPWKSNQIIPIETPGASSDIAGIHPDDLDAAASLMTNGRKAFADLKGTTRTEAIQRAHQFSANRAGIQPIAAQPASNPVAPNLQSEILPATEDIPTPVPFSGTKGTASTIGSNVGVADDTTAKIHNLYDYLATQRAELTPEILKKVANGEAVRVGDDWITQNEIQQKAADWARSQGRQAPKLTKQNPTGAYQSFDYVNQRRGGRGTAAEVIDMLTGKQPQDAHARPSGGVNANGQTLPNYGPLPQSPHAGIKPIQ